MKRKVITIIISIAIILSLFSVNVSAVQAESLSGGQLLKQYVTGNSDTEDTAVSTELTAGDEASINASYIQRYIESNETAKQSYGGCYIDDNGKLHVLFTENVANSVINSVNTMTENNTVYETCEYTLDELTALKEYISGFMSAEITDAELAEIANDISAVGIDEFSNKVFVKIKNCNEGKIQFFKDYISNSNAIVFKNSIGYQNTVDIITGSEIYISGAGYYSVGFRCKKLTSSGNYVNGFMTAAHGNGTGRSVYYYRSAYNQGVEIGYVMDRKYSYGSNVDCAFVYITNTAYIPTNTLYAQAGTLVSGIYATTYTYGNEVRMVGATTGYSYGHITSTSMDLEVGGIGETMVITDCVEANYVSAEGDSGGVVYEMVSLTCCLSGLVNSYEIDNTGQCLSAFIKIPNIINSFNGNLVIY